MDIGNYERFTDIAMTKDHNITTGRVYMDVIRAESARQISRAMRSDNSACYRCNKERSVRLQVRRG